MPIKGADGRPPSMRPAYAMHKQGAAYLLDALALLNAAAHNAGHVDLSCLYQHRRHCVLGT